MTGSIAPRLIGHRTPIPFSNSLELLKGMGGTC